MKSMHEALQEIARSARLETLKPNSDGFVELVVAGGAMSLYLQVVEESQIEVSTRLRAFDGRMNRGVMLELLAENGRRGFGRLALEPQSDSVIFGLRLDVAEMDRAMIAKTLNRFLREAALIERDLAPAILSRAEQHGVGRDRDDLTVIRP